MMRLFAGVLLAVSISACSGLDRGFPGGSSGEPASGGEGGGILSFLFDTEPEWISASAILRAIADGLSAESLTKHDAVQHGAMQYGALQTLAPGSSATWCNERTGHGGSTSVNDSFELSDGTVCKMFTETMIAGSASILRDGMACKAPGGDWEVRAAA